MLGLDDVPAVGKNNIDLVEIDRRDASGRGNARRSGFGERLRLVDRRVERVETIDHRFEAGKIGIIIHEESERIRHLRERAGGLRHRAELDLAGEVKRRGEDEWDDRRQLAEGLRKGGDPHAAKDHSEEVGDERREAAVEYVFLGILAAQQRNLLGVFAKPGQREAEVGFHVLALEIKADQRATDQMRDQRPGGRVEQRDPEQKAGQRDIGAGQRERLRQAPQHDGERDERRDGRDQQDREVVKPVGLARTVVAAVDETINVLGDALIGVVGLPSDQADPVMIVPGEPA